LLINQSTRQLLQRIVVVKLSSLFAVDTTYIVNTSPGTANPSYNRLIHSVLPQFQNIWRPMWGSKRSDDLLFYCAITD